MIHYKEKGHGLHEKICKFGHWLLQNDEGWTSSDDIEVQKLIDSYSIEEAKAYKIKEVLELSARKRDSVIHDKSAGEMSSWPIKREEAVNYNIDSSYPCPVLTSEAQVRGIALDQLVKKVLENSSMFCYAETQIGGVDGRHRDTIKNFSTFEEVLSYNINIGWPNI